MAELSPAAQVVMDAFLAQWDVYAVDDARHAIAAALRALADHQRQGIQAGQSVDHWDPDDRTRGELRNLADELEGANG